MSFGFGHGFTRGGGAAAAGGPAFAVNFTTGALPSGTTFSRGTTATYYNQSGLVTTNENLLLWSQDISNAAWSKGNLNTTGTPPYTDVISAPDGTLTADAVIENTTASAFHYVQQASAKPTTSSQYAAFVYLKDNGRQVAVTLQGTGGTNGITGRVNPATGTVVAAITTFGTGWTAGSLTITSVGSGWYLVALSGSSDTTASVVFQISLHNGTTNTYTGNGVSGVYVWGFQLQNGPNVSQYNPTTTAAVYGPRFDYDPVTLQPKGLLIEEARTNSATWSNPVGGTNGWTQTFTTTAVNSATSPDGSTSASLVSEDTTAAQPHAVFNSVVVPASTTVTLSCYAKAGGRNYAYIQYNDATSANAAWTSFNLLTGAVVTAPTQLGGTFTGMSSSAVNVGNGWYRLIFTLTTNTVVNGVMYLGTSPDGLQRTFTGSGAAAVYLYGAQSELGAFATSYIPTTSAAVTRNADLLSISNTPFYNGNIGSIAATWDTYAATSTPVNRTIVGIGNPWVGLMYQNTTSYPQATDNTTYTGGPTPLTGTGPYKMAWAWNTSTMGASVNGSTVTPVAFAGTFGSATVFTIGNGSNAWFINGHIKSFSYYNSALTNAQLQVLTT